MGSRNEWTSWQVEKLIEVVDAGGTSQEAADAVGLSRNACIGKARRLGLVWAGSPYIPRKEAPPPLRLEPLPPPGPVDFLSRPEGRCRWPLWQAPARTGLVCGEIVEAAGDPYCPGHMALAGQASRQRLRPSIPARGRSEEWR